MKVRIDLPLGLDTGTRPDEVSCGKNKLVVENPFTAKIEKKSGLILSKRWNQSDVRVGVKAT